MQDIKANIAKPLKAGELLVKEGFISLSDVEMALSIQKAKNPLNIGNPQLIGMILCRLNLLTPKDNYYVLDKYNKLMPIQDILLEKDMLSKKLVLKAEQQSKSQDIPFISCLLELGLISTAKIQQLLFDFFHIPFRSISDFVFNQKDREKLAQILNKQSSNINQIIPLVLKDSTILFGITDPDNILFIRQLNELFPQYKFKILFIPFADYLNVFQVIYGKTTLADPQSVEKHLDLSLLLKFKTSIENPEKEKKSIETLYERYELVRQLSGNLKREETHFKEFKNFIIQSHEAIRHEYKRESIEFSLKKEGKDIKIIALPQQSILSDFE